MALAVCVFILAYTALTSTEAFDRFHARPFIRRTLYIGYGARMAISIVFPIALYSDLFAGALSLRIVGEVIGLETTSFAGTFITTCVSGTLLNMMIFALMGVVYALQRALLRPPQEPRGFAVVMATPATAPPHLSPRV